MIDHAMEDASTSQLGPTFDVAILGGGIAGLTLAIQLTQAHPDISIVIAEKVKHPVPEAAHKVGESTVEIAAHYLRDVLGLGELLQRDHLNKFGLRVFFSRGDNRDISQRRELGHAVAPPQRVGTFQIDRGRLENRLTEQVSTLPNLTLLNQTKAVDAVVNSNSNHAIDLQTADGIQKIHARWVIDSTGRAAFIKRDLCLTQSVEHHANAVWLRIATQVDVDDWSGNSEWHDRIRECRRLLSTNHLMGHGYWVWIIPLASGATSIGIVTDPEWHDFGQLNNLDKALQWLDVHEPQCASAIRENVSDVLDFRVMRDYAFGAAQVFSADRWCLAGDAGIFLDPLYSPGMDLIAISNGLISDLIGRDRDGEDIDELCAIHNEMFKIITDGWLEIYTGQFPTMGNSRVMTSKIIWDTAAYWAVPGLLYFHDAIRRLVDHPEIVTGLARFSVNSRALQRFFREWAAVDDSEEGDPFLSFYDFDFMAPLHSGMTAGHADQDLAETFEHNVSLIELLSGQVIATVLAEYSSPNASPGQRQQAVAWRQSPLLMTLRDLYSDRDGFDVDPGWITGHKPREFRPQEQS